MHEHHVPSSADALPSLRRAFAWSGAGFAAMLVASIAACSSGNAVAQPTCTGVPAEARLLDAAKALCTHVRTAEHGPDMRLELLSDGGQPVRAERQ